MKFKVPEDLQDYVKHTKYCDVDSLEVRHKAECLTEAATSPKEAAMKIFYFVRDEFLFGFTNVNEKASETLQGNLGWCVTKANLQIALLRSIGIPARYHQVALKKIALKGIILNSLYKNMEEKIWFHPWCECFIDNKWIACDLWIDKLTWEAAIKSGIYSKDFFPTVDWDGEHDLIIVNHWMLEDIGTHQTYVDIVDKVVAEMKIPAFLLNIAVKLSNRHTARFRSKYS